MKKDNSKQIFYGYIPQSSGAAVPAIAALGAAAGSVKTGQIIMDSDSDWVWTQGVFSAVDNTGDVTDSVLATVQIVDTTDQSNVFFAPVFIRNAFGTSQLPYYLPRGIRFGARTTLNVTVTSLGNANAVDLYFLLGGIKDFTQGQVPLLSVPV